MESALPDTPIRALVFPCGTEIALEIQRALAPVAEVQLVGASSAASNHGPMVFAEYHAGIPLASDPGCVPALAELARHADIDCIFPAHDDVMLLLSEHIRALPCALLTSSAETCRTCRNKRLTYARLEGVVPTPAVHAPAGAQHHLPVFIKPESGHGSRHSYLIETPEDLAYWLAQRDDWIIMEHLPSAEFTIDCFTDGHGKLRFAGARERVRVVRGISMDTRPADEPELLEWAQRINDAMPLRGAWFFQAKRDREGRFKLLEVAPRVSGSMGLYRAGGINFPLWTILDSMGAALPEPAVHHPAQLDRALASRYRLELDYSLVLIRLDGWFARGRQPDPMVVAFLAQARQAGKRVLGVASAPEATAAALTEAGLVGLFEGCATEAEAFAMASGAETALYLDNDPVRRAALCRGKAMHALGLDACEALIDWRR